jgi:putative flippase GtrA
MLRRRAMIDLGRDAGLKVKHAAYVVPSLRESPLAADAASAVVASMGAQYYVQFRNSLRGQAMRFVSSGVANTVTGFAVIFLLMALGVRPVVANVAGYAVGLSLSFLLSRRYVFAGAGTLHGEAGRFLVAFAIAFAANLAMLQILIGHFEVTPVVAQVLSAATYTMAMFVLGRWFVFRQTPPAQS